jgi:hypothetical protein
MTENGPACDVRQCVARRISHILPWSGSNNAMTACTIAPSRDGGMFESVPGAGPMAALLTVSISAALGAATFAITLIGLAAFG